MSCTRPVGGPRHRRSRVRRRGARRDRRRPGQRRRAHPGPRVGPGGGRHRGRARLLRLADPLRRPRPPARSRRAIGEYGNKVVLATPIEAILSAPAAARPPAGAPALLRRATAARRSRCPACRRARAACWPGPPSAAAGPCSPRRPARSAATRSRSSCPARRWRPRSRPATSRSAPSAPSPTATATRSSPSATRSTGSAARSLFMQDAYVFGVIGNPLGVPDLGAITYKLTSSGGHPLGAITNDTFSAIAARLGAGAALDPAARERPPARRGARDARLAPRRRARARPGRRPVASSPRWPPRRRSTACSAPSSPSRMKVCMRFRVRELRQPDRVLQPLLRLPSTRSPTSPTPPRWSTSFDLAPLDIRERAEWRMTVERGVTDELIVGARVLRPRAARRGGAGAGRAAPPRRRAAHGDRAASRSRATLRPGMRSS